MSLEQCRQNLVELLSETENRVVALSGKWGTGKTYLLREVQAASTDDKIKNAVYVSLFGLKSVNELKLKIAQGVIPKLEKGSAIFESVKAGYEGTKKVLKSIHSGFSALDDLALIAAPMMIKGRFIVVDDIERKHKDLSIDEILGFIDDCVQTLECRILLVLNSDQLEDRKIWDVFREKVIDQELRLDTSPNEAFAIASRLTPSPFSERILTAIETCQISNIRVIRKIVRVVNRLLAHRAPLPAQVLDRVIPSITLLGAINYKGLEDGPDFDFVINFQAYLISRAGLNRRNAAEAEAPEQQSREKWSLLLSKLGILGTDEFEVLVVDYLRSGLFDPAGVNRIIDRYLAEERLLEAKVHADTFFEHAWWFPNLTNEQLLTEAIALRGDARFLDMYTVTALFDRISQLPNGQPVAQQLVDDWLTAFRERHRQGQEAPLDPDRDYARRSLHPDISAEFQQVLAGQQVAMTLFEVCKQISTNGWGSAEENFLQSISAQQYETALRTNSGSQLRTILLQSMDLYKNRGAYGARFGQATQRFGEACRSIVQRDPDSRLATLIREVFNDADLQADLA